MRCSSGWLQTPAFSEEKKNQSSHQPNRFLGPFINVTSLFICTEWRRVLMQVGWGPKPPSEATHSVLIAIAALRHLPFHYIYFQFPCLTPQGGSQDSGVLPTATPHQSPPTQPYHLPMHPAPADGPLIVLKQTCRHWGGWRREEKGGGTVVMGEEGNGGCSVSGGAGGGVARPSSCLQPLGRRPE